MPAVEERTARAIALSDRGDIPQAESLFREMLNEQPDAASAHHNLAVCLVKQARGREARVHLTEAIRLEPAYGQAHRALGSLLHADGEYAEAERHLRRAIELDAVDSEALNNLGVVLNSLLRFEEASVFLRQAVRLKPHVADPYNNLGIALTSMGRLREARRQLAIALELKPDYAAAHANLANAYKEEQRLPEALACYDLALALAPDTVSTRWNRSLALLQQGDYERGWEEYEWRWRRPQTPPRRFAEPAWTGDALRGRTILLYAEQGLGDTVQFVRYGALLRATGARVLLECPRPLVTLLERCPGLDAVIPEGDALPPFDVHAPLMSLPRLCHTTLADVPATVPYLRVDTEHMAEIGRPGDHRVGIAWQGNPHHQWDRFRSVRFAELETLAGVRGVQLVSLQIGPGSDQLAAARRRARIVAPFDGRGADWAEIAALVTQLDLVITVDTATAHVAGALGVPVWILISAISDWRWLTGRADSPWYPTARLYRQRGLGGWRRVIERVRGDLAARVRCTASARSSS